MADSIIDRRMEEASIGFMTILDDGNLPYSRKLGGYVVGRDMLWGGICCEEGYVVGSNMLC